MEDKMKKEEQLNPEALVDLIEACESALTYINELLIDNEIDKDGKKVSDKLYSALKKSGRL